jgi:hypothetical protein
MSTILRMGSTNLLMEELIQNTKQIHERISYLKYRCCYDLEISEDMIIRKNILRKNANILLEI